MVVVQVGAWDGQSLLKSLAFDVELEEKSAILKAKYEVVVRVSGVNEETSRSGRLELEKKLFLVSSGEPFAIWHLEREVLAPSERELLARPLWFG